MAPATTTDVGERRAIERMRVLVVDDNRDSARSLATLLRVLGYDVEMAHDGTDGLARALAWRPRVVLLDLGMPVLDGYETCRRLRETAGPSMTVIAITGWGQERDRERARAAGFDHHLTKPVDIDELRTILANASQGV